MIEVKPFYQRKEESKVNSTYCIKMAISEKNHFGCKNNKLQNRAVLAQE